jgi:hypothetical protein
MEVSMDIYVLEADAPPCPGCHQPLEQISLTLFIDGKQILARESTWAPGMAGYVVPPSLVRWLDPDLGGELVCQCRHCSQRITLTAGPGLFSPDVPHMLIFPPGQPEG